MASRTSSIAFALLLAACCSPALPDWPMFRHDPARTGRAEGPAPQAASVAWAVDLGGPVDSSPAVVGEVVYVGTAAGVFHARDAATGAEKWHAAIGRPVVSSPCVAAGRVFLGCVDGYVYALDAATGSRAWRARTERSVVAPPLAVGDLVLCGSTDGRLYALAAADGKVVWRTERGGEIHAGAAATEQLAVFADWEGKVRAVALRDGAPVWAQAYAADGPVEACPVIEGDTVVVASLAPTALSPSASLNIHALELATGARRWGRPGRNPWQTDKEGPMSVATCPTLIGEALWFVSLEGYGNWSATVRSVTLATGVRGAAVPRNALAQGWAVSDSSPAAAGGLLYFADYAGLLHQFNAANRRPLRALVLEGQTLSSPAISDGRLYLGLTTGKLLCLD